MSFVARPTLADTARALFFAFTLALLASCVVSTAVLAQGSWALEAPMPTSRKEIANCSAVIDGKVHVVGGVANNGTMTGVHEVYDPIGDAWQTLAPLPIVIWRASAATVGGKLYVFGGYQSLGAFPFSPTNRMFEYDPGADGWSEKTAMPTARGAHTAVAVDGLIHVIGGAASGPLDRHEVYDPVANTWSVGPAMPTARSGLTGGAIDGVIYVAGGYILSGGVVAQDALEAYDVDSGLWSAKQDMPLAKLGIAASVVDGRLFVFGGDTNAQVPTKALEYDPDTNAWTQLADMPVPVNFMSVATVGNTIYVAGGGPVNLNRFDGVNANRAFVPPGVTGIADGATVEGAARVAVLGQNHPNPFNPETSIEYALGERARVRIDVFDAAGRAVATLVDREQAAGDQRVTWNGRDASGRSMPSGVYLYRLTLQQATGRRGDGGQAGERGGSTGGATLMSRTRRMLLLK